MGCGGSRQNIHSARLERPQPAVQRYNTGYYNSRFLEVSGAFDAHTEHYFVGTSQSDDDYRAASEDNMMVIQNENSAQLSVRGGVVKAEMVIGAYGNMGFTNKGNYKSLGMTIGGQGPIVGFSGNLGFGENESYAVTETSTSSYYDYEVDENSVYIIRNVEDLNSTYFEIGAALSLFPLTEKEGLLVSLGTEFKTFSSSGGLGYTNHIFTAQCYYTLLEYMRLGAHLDNTALIMKGRVKPSYITGGADVTVFFEFP